VVALLDRPSRPDDLDPETMTDVALAAELVALRREIDRLDAEFARLAWAGHQRGIGSVDGSPSTQAWLRRDTGMREGDARAAITASEVCELLPSIGMAWRDGWITTGAARTIAAARLEEHDPKLRALEPLLLDLAKAGDQREVRRACTHFRNCATADGSCPREHDGLTISTGYGGRGLIQADLSSSALETVENAIHTLTDAPSDADTGASPGRCARAHGRARDGDPGCRGQDGPVRARPAANLVVDWQTLTGETWGRIDGEYTGTLHRRDVERMLCDRTLSRVVTGPDGLPLDVGRSRRTVPPQTRRALAVRDGGCRYPGCTRPPGWCDAHHVIHWNDGGVTDLVNLVFHCDHHHVVHQPDREVRRPRTPRLPTRRHRSHLNARARSCDTRRMEIRPFEASDTEAVVTLWEACELTRLWNDPRKDIARRVAVDDGLFLVADVDGSVVATVMAGYDGHRGWVNYLAVDPECRGLGYGRGLMAEAEGRLAARGCPKVNLQIRDSNTAVLAFYERLGYAVDAAVSMGKRLESDEP
jgi:GNAT superfamily N-acetyltransferase